MLLRFLSRLLIISIPRSVAHRTVKKRASSFRPFLLGWVAGAPVRTAHTKTVRFVSLQTLGILMLFVFLIISNLSHAQQTSLNGTWNFALDPTKSGETFDWHKPWKIEENTPLGYTAGWDVAEVPHCFSIDKRFEGYIGTVWYRRMFEYNGNLSQKHLRLHFAAVFYKCRVWLNGELVGFHEGGYTPFEFDITDLAKKGNNFLVLEVDNAWDHTTIPGARLGEQPKNLLYPWWEYGGITRDVYLKEIGKVFVSKQKIEAEPDLQKGGAIIKVITWIRNVGTEQVSLSSELALQTGEEKITLGRKNKERSKAITIKPKTIEIITQTVNLSPDQVSLWHFDHPHLYNLQTTLSAGTGTDLNTFNEQFGIRKIETKNGKLFLNGEAIRVGGANRHSDHPKFASMDNEEVANQDMPLIKEAHMVFSRLNHTPTSTAFMDWCDENGFMVIAEPGNWQISPQQMADPIMRAKFIQQMGELIERDWNRPSVIGWSMGNEYNSWTPEGDAWTGDMIAIARELDSTRLLTFVSIGNGGTKENLATAHDSFRYCDLICINTYGGAGSLARLAENLHEKYPEKPIYLSEFGRRADYFTPEERIEYFKEHIDWVRKNDYMVGTSWWAFNDYRSRYPNTNENGYREWGLVDPQRNTRPLYDVMKAEYAPALLTFENNKVKVQARDDYPSYTLKGYTLVYSDAGNIKQKITLKTLKPGETQEVEITNVSQGTTVKLISPTGFTVVEKTF